MGGDDITTLFHLLLERINFPYRDIDLAQSYDWSVMDELKAGMCTLHEVCRFDISALLNRFLTSSTFFLFFHQPEATMVSRSFYVRRPDRPAERYEVKALRETILAPLVSCLYLWSVSPTSFVDSLCIVHLRASSH
jgi:actin-related protein 8